MLACCTLSVHTPTLTALIVTLRVVADSLPKRLKAVEWLWTGRSQQVPEEDADMEEIPREDLAPNIMRGYWQIDPQQRRLWARLRCGRTPARPLPLR